ncbi:GNAT family N-acetyltransferase [Arthrobacter wenxiniae]|jgi:ribosomal-protein-alanine N-acetyltransferase|uniref:GNAT family N-acetyltransferase n=1 Tax=Arthrobacter wenxiniae TaxID=2713570 RepID=A0A7Y7IGL3_9MICC|nr:GNAT family N-acetyltransferase [Arthrobacter wenxiniae]NVM95099.1 GNAT family N-acetyltransferase [Arthrobacter wenxiniae]
MTAALQDSVSIRPLALSDAAALARCHARNRAYLQPWEPVRPESFYTAAGQRERLAVSLAEQAAGRSFFWAVVDAGRLAGCISLTDVVRGAFQNGHVGYWVAEDRQGRGLATTAVGFVGAFATELGLHRLQAGTLVHNTASRKVLARNGFAEIGTAPNYIRINGSWQDHVLYQKVLHG